WMRFDLATAMSAIRSSTIAVGTRRQRGCREKAQPGARANGHTCHDPCYRTARAKCSRGSSLTLGEMKRFTFHGFVTTLLFVATVAQLWLLVRLDGGLNEARRDSAALQKRLDEEAYIRSRWMQKNQPSVDQRPVGDAAEKPR